jgi:hypothetical protein
MMASGLEIANLGNCRICHQHFPKFRQTSPHMPLLSFSEKSAGNGRCFCALLYRKVSQCAEDFKVPDRINLGLMRNRRLLGCIIQKVADGVAQDGTEQTATHYGAPNLYVAPFEGVLTGQT